jgi:Xaa-Pro dipeptidase
MTFAIEPAEYRRRLAAARASMAERGIEVLLVGDIANQYWLTGCEGWSFYLPQLVIVTQSDPEPLWIGRAMDAPGAAMTGYMDASRVLSYPERYVHRPDRHPCDHIAAYLADRGLAKAAIGYEADAYYFTPKCVDVLKKGLPGARFVEADLLVNWLRAIKSEAEIGLIRNGARLVEKAMAAAYDLIRPGVRQCDVVGELYKVQIAGAPDYSGDLTSLCPIILAGKAGSTAHPIWSEERFPDHQVVAVELAGACRRYHAALCRTVHLGKPADAVRDTYAAVREGLESVLGFARAGVTAHDVHAAWKRVLDKHKLTKESRIGYSIGIGYPPDWGEHTVSLRAEEDTEIRENMVLHVVLGMWMSGWGLELSETILIGKSSCEAVTRYPRELFVRA